MPQLRAALALKSHAGLAPFCTLYGLIFRNSLRRISRLNQQENPRYESGRIHSVARVRPLYPLLLVGNPLEKQGAEIALGCIRQDGDDGFPLEFGHFAQPHGDGRRGPA